MNVLAVVALCVSMFCAGITFGMTKQGNMPQAYVCGFADGINYALTRTGAENIKVEEHCSEYRIK